MEDGVQTFGVEEFKSFMETEEGRKILNPMFDSKVSKAIDTWKTNNLEKVVNDELVKKGFVQTEEQKQMLALQQEIENIKREKAMAELNAIKLSELSNNGLPNTFANYVVGDSEEAIRESILGLKSTFETTVAEAVKKKVANTGGKLDELHKKTEIPQDLDIDKMPYHERNKLKQENPELFKKLMGLN